jgi:hypothetical protein
MSAVQSAVKAHLIGDANGFDDAGIDLDIVDAVDANGDPMTATSSSEEDIASCSSNNDEKDDVIQLKTR